MTLKEKYRKKYYASGGSMGGGSMGGGIGGTLGTALPALANTGADLIDENRMANGRGRSVGGSTLKGAASGAALGSSILPGWGTAIGAVVGAAAGFVMGKKNQAKDRVMQFNQGLMRDQMQLKRSAAIIGNNPALVTGKLGDEFYAMGGSLKNRYYDNVKAVGGNLKSLSDEAAEVQGPSHEQGGVDLPQYQSQVEGNETIQGDYVFSDRLGFAAIHKKLAKAIGKIENKPSTPDRINSLKRMNQSIENLKAKQEQIRQQYNLQ